MDDETDAMDQGTHIALWETSEGLIGCDCGALVYCEAWERHCEQES